MDLSGEFGCQDGVDLGAPFPVLYGMHLVVLLVY